MLLERQQSLIYRKLTLFTVSFAFSQWTHSLIQSFPYMSMSKSCMTHLCVTNYVVTSLAVERKFASLEHWKVYESDLIPSLALKEPSNELSVSLETCLFVCFCLFLCILFWWFWILLLLVCLVSQQYASVSQGQTCLDNCMYHVLPHQQYGASQS